MINKTDKIFVAGGTGFFGTAIRNELVKAGYEKVSHHITGRVSLDLTSQQDTLEFFSKYKFDVIINAAGNVGGLGYNKSSPASICYDNAMISLNLAMNCVDVKKYVNILTVCAYPKFAKVPFKEEDLFNGLPEETNNPYGQAKRLGLTFVNACRDQFGLNAITVIPTNMMGPNDCYEEGRTHVIPALIMKVDKALENKESKVPLWGTGLASREFLDVRDGARGIRLAMEKYDGTDPINLGTGNEVKIEELADKIGGLMGYSGQFEFDCEAMDGQPRRCLDVEKAKEKFNFMAEIDLETSLRDCVKYYYKEIKGK